jgi:hypothetical protein
MLMLMPMQMLLLMLMLMQMRMLMLMQMLRPPTKAKRPMSLRLCHSRYVTPAMSLPVLAMPMIP